MGNAQTVNEARILIVDDEPMNIAVLRVVLEESGYENTIGVADPFEAVEIYGEEPFDLVLMDLQMDGLNGFEVMARLREIPRLPRPPVLVMTAHGDRETRVRALKEGANDFITKPFDHDETLSRIANLLEMFKAQQQLKAANDQLEERVRERTNELNLAKLEIVQRLGKAAEYRDTDTGLHTVRVGCFARLLGQAIGLDEDKYELLRYAAPMHDVGKIGVPDHILLKPGKLDPQEWDLMKTHAEIGARLLDGSNSDVLECAKVIALNHHERWDGTGYPNGLKSEDIPLSGRIVAIADVFDALTTRRPYKEAWPLDKARAQILADSGKMFDPALVEAFDRNFDKFVEVKRSYNDDPVTA